MSVFSALCSYRGFFRFNLLAIMILFVQRMLMHENYYFFPQFALKIQ